MRLPQGSHKWIDQLKAIPDKKTLRVAIQAACGANEGSFGGVLTGAFTRRQERGNFKYKSFLNERCKTCYNFYNSNCGGCREFLSKNPRFPTSASQLQYPSYYSTWGSAVVMTGLPKYIGLYKRGWTG